MRADNSLTEKRVYEFAAYRLDAAQRALECAGRPLSITPKALDVLVVLVENRGRIMEKEDLMEKVWAGTFVEDNNLAFNISVLRKLLGDTSGSPRFIETVPRRGYRFIAEVLEVPNGVADQGAPAQVDTPSSAPTPTPAPARSRGRWIPLTALLTLAAAAILATSFFGRAPKLTERDTIVLADFDNKTGDSVFEETLRQGLAIQLEQSPYLSLVSDQRIRATLRLMGQPGEIRLNRKLAGEVCERTASAAFLEGSIALLGSRYVMGLRATNCHTGEVLYDEQVQASRKEDILNVLSQIASRFRARVGESLVTVKKYDTPLAEAMTPSLEALKAYSAGWKVASSAGNPESIPFFRRAVEIDPKFAMAWARLGHAQVGDGEPALGAEAITKAYQLRDRASDQERFFIAASYEMEVTGNLVKARQTCEMWAKTYPRDIPAHGFLAGAIYPVLAKYENAAEEGRKQILAGPDVAFAYGNTAFAYIRLNRLADAAATLQQASQRKLQMPDYSIARYEIAFLRGDRPGMEREVAQAQGTPGAEDWLSDLDALALAYTGHLRQARDRSHHAAELAQLATQGERAAGWAAGPALWEGFFGNASEAKRGAMVVLALSRGRDPEYSAALSLALAGDASGSERLAYDLQARFPEDTAVRYSYLPTVRAVLALKRGEPSKAIELLQIAAPYELAAPPSAFFGFFGALYPVYVRGEAYLAAHQGANAAAEFQKILAHRGIVVSDPIGALARLQIGRAFVLSGDKTRAKAAYQDFLSLWRDADADIAILKQAKTEFALFN